jgi:hypothetical protein
MKDGEYTIDGNNVVYSNGMIFHISFAESYKGMTIINTRRKLKTFYTKKAQNLIIHYLKDINYIN